MTASLRLIRIEAKRSPAIWLVPVIIAVSWWLLSFQSWVDFLWRSTNELLQVSTVSFAAPAMAGAAAWVAGRDRRRGVEDLLATTPRSVTRRQLALWAATSFWGLLAYGLFAAYMLGSTARLATADGIALLPIATVIAAILAHTAWGQFIGGLIPSRFTAPVVAIGALGIQQFAASRQVQVGDFFYTSTWFNQLAAHSDSTWWTTALYATLAAAGLVIIGVRAQPGFLNIAILVVTFALIAGSVVMIWGNYPQINSDTPEVLNNFGRPLSWSYTPFPEICDGAPVTVCTTQDMKPILAKGVRTANELAAPLMGLPGAPLRVEQDRIGYSVGPGRSTALLFDGYAADLVANPDTLVDGNPSHESQIAIRDWLLLRTGQNMCEYIDPNPPTLPFNTGWSTSETCAATERFMALPEAEQRAWLEAHYIALRAGELTLDDLP